MNADGRGLVEQELTGRIIGVFYEVYNELGAGFLESVYEASMTIALEEAGLAAQRQMPIDVWFRGHRVGEYRADLLVDGRVILELKATKAIVPAHEAQLLNYLRATGKQVGLLLNFGPKPTFKRFVSQNKHPIHNPHSPS